MSRRLPSTPPTLPGFSFVRVLGSGGFADVFLYEQNMPRRLVAVKVLLAEVVNDDLRRMFQAEVNVMAQLSSHPSILTVYQAGVAADGRPYLVMEFCPSGLGQRYRAAPIPLSEVLSTGVRIAGAVETAHRSSVLHRDIKPSNILSTAYGHPVLSDFGIAATLGGSETADAIGMSIPWSAPEVLHDDVAGTVHTEVWSLGATVYSLLAGRSPFEEPDRENTPKQVAARIGRTGLRPTGRADVPASLEAVLARAMSKRPQDRQGGAMEFGRDLQAVELELGLPQTPLEVGSDEWEAVAIDLDERTSLAASPVIQRRRTTRRRRSNDAMAATTRRADSRAAGATTGASRGSGATGGTGATGAPANGDARSARRTRRLVWGLGAASAILVVGLTVGIVLLTTATAAVPVVTDVRGTVDDETVSFSWDDPGLRADDAYIVVVDGEAQPAQHATNLEHAASAGDHVCASVTVTRDGKSGKPSEQRCVDVDSR
ncbi:serine/threonine protein kinase [Agromyces terreus]|uniref:non-specific serine/threonine protein kinase n=2 Tax=Agromyces terreus TaxID=424795 RepID=A0A9X2KCN3_9MICO|nr:serine/threonine-protein kinase [Agromyces terreus]MCP2371440.1 serine/threonine protein kinase [Agromyces terreus]